MGISINDIGNEISKAASNAAKTVNAASAAAVNGAAAALDTDVSKVAKYTEGTLDKLWASGVRGGEVAARLIRHEGDVLSSAIESVRDMRDTASLASGTILGTLVDATADAGGKVGASFGGLFSDILKEKQGQLGALKDVLLGQNPKLDRLDLFDVLSARQNGLIEKMPVPNLKDLLAKIRDLLGQNPFENIPTLKPFPGLVKPLPFPGPFKPLPFPQPNPLAGVVQMLRDVIAALVEAIKARATQPGQGTTQPGQGGTEPLPPITTGEVGTPNRPGSTGDDFQDAILGQVQGVDDKINKIKEELKKPGITAEESQRLMIELQDQLQLKRQLIEMLTNISKAFHDMAMAVIRNLAV